MENPMNNMMGKHEEVAKGGQLTVVIGFVATFLLGIVFVFVIGNLLGQISDNVQNINLELTGTKTLLVKSTSNACLYAYVQAGNSAVLSDTTKTDAVKMEEVLNAYDSAKLASLSTDVLNCTVAATPVNLGAKATGVTVTKSGEGFTVESALVSILK